MADAGSDSDSDEDGVEYSEMQQPSLMKQLQTILSEYPDDGQILKEIVQNAEDAEATELKILYDGRDVNVDPNKNKKRRFRKYFRGAGLVIYNNAEFTNEDWKGITTLYSSNKEFDRTKVGKFGLGFKSVFHITDHPIIISGEYMLILDPHQKNPSKVCTKLKLAKLDRCRGMDKSDLLTCLSGIFGFGQDVLEKGYYKGTIFRFSLRGTTSELSDNIYDEEKLSDLIRSFQMEASVTLLFLKSMEKIEIFARNSSYFPEISDGKPIFTVKISGENRIKVKNERKNFLGKIKKFKKQIPQEALSSHFEVTIHTSQYETETASFSYSETETSWFVYNLLEGQKMSEHMRLLSEDEGLGYSPYVGIAYPLSPLSGTEFKGHIFCFLPLPLEQKSLTGLPVHVNGFFALSQNRRYVKWATGDQISNRSHKDKAIQWNEGLISEILPKIYAKIIIFLINKSKMNQNAECFVSMVTRCIPDIDAVNEKWHGLVKPLFTSLLNQAFLFTRNNGGHWIKAGEGVFAECRGSDNSKIMCESDVEKTLLKLVEQYGQNLLHVPPHIRRMIEREVTSPQYITPHYICQLLRTSELYTTLTSEEKLQVLQFLLENGDYKDLDGLKLLPLHSGSFTQFIRRQNSCSSKVFYCHLSDDIKMFPGIEQYFVSADLSSKNHFEQIIQQELYQIFPFGQSDFETLIKQSIKAQFPMNISLIEKTARIEEWLQIVWTYLRQNLPKFEDQFKNITLLPALLYPDNKYNLYGLSGLYILKSYRGMSNLPDQICRCLQHLSITVLQSLPEYVTEHPAVMGKLVHYPNSASVIQLLAKLTESGVGSSIVSQFNEKTKEDDKKFFSTYIQEFILSEKPTLSDHAISFLRQINLFMGSLSTKNVSVNHVQRIAPRLEIPVSYPKELLMCKDQRQRKFAELLGAAQMTLSSLICEILDQLAHPSQSVYSSDDKRKLMSFVKEKMQTDDPVMKKAREVPFVLTRDGKEYKPNDVYDGSDITLSNLFPYEDKFPLGEFCTPEGRDFLRKLGIRTLDSLTAKEVEKSAVYLHEHSNDIRGIDRNQKQSKAIMSVLQDKTHLLKQQYGMSDQTLSSALHELNIASAKLQPPDEYPSMLNWYGAENMLYKPSQMYEARHYKLVGSVAPLFPDGISETLVQGFEIGKPSISLVLQQLNLIVLHYENKYKPELLPLIKGIYIYLTENADSSCNELRSKKCAWTGNGFCHPNMVYITSKESDIALEPYLYPMSSDLQNIPNIEDLFMNIGAKTCQNWEALRNVQEMILKKHTAESVQATMGMKHDLQLVISILNHMKGMLNELDGADEKVLIPIHTDDNKLVLKTVKECRYSNADWLKDISMEEEEEIFFVHPDVPCETAMKLGVPSLTDDLLSEAEGFEEWGQKEPLTRRIKNILKDYTDGFSVPKEIVQNADDAGASKVCFIYDERENEDAKVRLLDENMSSCQGPALWAYNDAPFTKEDLENITKLSGATKEDDLKKIGKFGLGFCCVYNLTDVPSFITGDQMVIFDPHAKYLGKAVTTSNPGLKINLNSLKNQTMMKRLKNQFKPFNGIFGCDLTMQDGFQPFDGSLFRFPLRTHKQALESDICSKPYLKEEMKVLLNLFMESAGNILLFTQNVSEIELHHIPENAVSPDESVLIYKVKRDISVYKRRSNIGMSMTDGSLLQLDPVSNISVVRDLSDSIGKARQLQQTDFEKISLCAQVDIEIDVKKEAREFGKQPMEHIKGSWLVSWASGTDASKHLVFQPEMKKALPLASVASLIVKNSKGIKPKPIKESPYGFYKESHFFCYLPLPVQCPLPVHINGSFAVTANRRQLIVKNIDDKVSLESIWNEALMSDAVCNAYILLLEWLQKLGYESDGIYSKIWPVLEDADYSAFQQRFYQKVERENPVIFRRNNITKSYSNCLFLEPSLMNSDVGEQIFWAAVYFKEEDSNVTVMPLHEKVKNCFEKAGCMESLSGKILTFDLFYKDIFFPKITSEYWEDKMETRNELVHYALSQNTTCLDNQIRTTPCVPSEPNGKLKKPEELIHPKSSVTKLFNIEDEWFISTKACKGKFHDETVLTKLISLGLVNNHLPNDIVIDRVQSIEMLARKCSCCGRERFKSVMAYLTEHVQFDDGKSVLPKIQHIKFLPVKRKPDTWEFPWAGDLVYQTTMGTFCPCDKHDTGYNADAVIYKEPSVLYRKMAEKLVFCQELILEEAEIERSDSDRLLNDLGVKGEYKLNDISLKSVANNLVSLCKLETTKLSTQSIELLSDICTAVYKYFDLKLAEIEDNMIATYSRESLEKHLKENPVILLNGQFLSPERVVLHLHIDCSPCIYGINKDSLCHRKNFLQAIGVKERFEFQDLLLIILQEQNKYIDVKLARDELDHFCKLLNVLSDSMKDESITADDFKNRGGTRILVPDENCMLKPIDDLCMDDSKNIRRSKTMTFVNEKISLEIASRLGIRSKKRKQLKEHSRRLPFGQKEELTTRIKRLLDGYPCDEGILKELIQNADDAGANEIHIIKDFKPHPSEHVFDKWEPLQGPALLVYNDSAFSEADIEGIQKLGIGSKGDDATKTGQFGVGFNAVYHLTDVPSFLTRGPEVESGETLCVLDPHRRYVEEDEEDSPGMQYVELEDIKATYPDVFGCYYEEQLLKEKGTVFRFPLRTDKMATESSIKEDPITPDHVNGLMDQFREEMIKMLLFVKHVERIRISDITTGKLIEECSVEVCISDEDKKKRTEFMEYMKTVGRELKQTRELKAINVKQVDYTVRVRDNKGCSHSWLVVQQIGLKKTGDEISESVLTGYREGKNGLLPIGGVALPLEYTGSESLFTAFCFLPLPCLTGLPIIINGHFDLDHETRRNLWKSDKTDHRVLWNETLIQKAISPAYVRAVQLFKAKLGLCNETTVESSILNQKLSQYHSVFPDFRNTSEQYWIFLASSFYRQVVENEEDMFASCHRVSKKNDDLRKISFYPLLSKGSKFVSLFDDLSSNPPYIEYVKKSENLRQTCKTLGMKLLDSPLFLYENLKHAKVEEAAVLTPKHLVEFLKSFSDDRISDRCKLHGLNAPVTQTTFSDKKNVIECLRYCKQSTSFLDQMEGLPLCLTNDDVLHTFSRENPVYCTTYCSLFQNSSKYFLSSDIVTFFGCQFAPAYRSDNTNRLFGHRIFRPFEMNDLVKCLLETLDPGKYRKNISIQWQSNAFPDVDWMKRFWQLVYNIVIPKIQDKHEKDDCLVKLLEPLSDWCILPCQKSFFRENMKVLLPISGLQMVVLTSSFSPNMKETLTQLSLPEISADSIDKKEYDLITTHLVARQEKPLVVLNCLYLHREKMNTLTELQSNAILEYLTENLQELSYTEDTKKKLKYLPIHVTIHRTRTDLVNQPDVFLLPQGLPLNGMKIWGEKSGILLLKSFEKLKPLYKFLQFSESSHYDVYTDHIFKNFHFLPPSDQIAHLRYIKDQLLPSAHKGTRQYSRLIEGLKLLPFIRTNRGEKTASKFYSRFNNVFAVMGSFLEFPPRPFCEKEWQRFMEQAGMITAVTEDMFMSFISQVEKEGIHSKNIESKSRTLVQHLFEMDLNKETLQKISKVKFIVPEPVSDFLMAVHKQRSIDRLICFSESVSNQHHKLVWTTCILLPTWANTSDALMSDLNVCNSPTLEKIVQHIQNVCDSLKEHLERDRNHWKDRSDDIHKLMSSLYKYLHNEALKDEEKKQLIKQGLESKPLVYMPDYKRMLKCSSVVRELETDDIIRPFQYPLYPLPDDFVPYFKLFEVLGTNRKISFDNYAKVLENMFVALGGEEMHINELIIASTVIYKLFLLLPFNQSEISQGQGVGLKVKVLYLPSAKHILVDSKKLIYLDYNWCEKYMTREENAEYFVGFKKLEIPFTRERGQNCIKMLPECYRPTFVSQLVQFSVNTDSLEYVFSDEGKRFQDFIQTQKFIECILRLVHHENNRDDQIKRQKLEIDDSRIISQLRSITVRQVENIEKEWTYKDKIIRRENIFSYFEEKQDGQMKQWLFYFCINTSHWIQIIDYTFATMLNKCIGHLLGESKAHMFKILSYMSTPDNLEKLLDGLDITEYSKSGTSAETAFPPAGTIVHPKWHFLLDNNFTEFEIGEYVALQLADDDIPDENESDTGQVFMFAIVRGKKDAGSELFPSVFQKYILEVGTGEEREFPAYKMYKLNRRTEPECMEIIPAGHAVSGQEFESRSLEDVFKEIRQILNSIWERPEDEKKYIIKRLLRKWHPDKNYGNEEFAKKVFQFIKNCIQRLENNENIDDVSESSSNSTKGNRSSPKYEAWFQDVDRTCRRDRYYRKSAQQESSSYSSYSSRGSRGSRSYAGSGSYSSRTDETPLPQEARRWYKQALNDLLAAETFNPDAGDIHAYNWICYNCHQAAEKAMKAVWYGINANRVTKSHDLRTIALGLGPKIEELANSLDSLLGNHLYMRYPDILEMPKVPSDIFNASTSSRAIQITQQLCAVVKTNLS